ncbi:MAG TPA: hypothetical protein VEY09_12330 [Pyrinomonadaceae bacterium]|nr:hypothetical protein [Pyrinomonadaceae bacterium]
MSPEAFAHFLRALSPDAEEAARRYTSLQRKLAGFFALKGVSDTTDAANETLDRAARKIFEGAPVPDVDRFCIGIARNIVKERLRRGQREHEAFVTFLETLPDSSEEIERIRLVLMPCFEQLAEDEKQLLVDYCQVARGRARAEHRRWLASEMKTTVLALRMRVTRLRGALADCVRLRAASVY